MWSIGMADGSAVPAGSAPHRHWPASLERLRDSNPHGYFVAWSVLYLLAVQSALTLTPAGAPYGLIDPAPGVAALWLSTSARSPRWWRDRATWPAAAVVVLTGPVLLLVAGHAPALALGHGPFALAAATATLLLWHYALRPRQGGVVAGVWRLLITGLLAGLTSLVAVPWVPTTQAPTATLLIALTWAARVTAGLVGPLLIGQALLAPSLRGAERLDVSAPGDAGPQAAQAQAQAQARRERTPLHEPVRARTARSRIVGAVPLLAATAVVGSAQILADQRLYLCIPLLVWAASTLSVRGTAGYVVVVLVLVLREAPAAVGPFAAGGLLDRTLTASTVVLVVVGVTMTLAGARAERSALLAAVTARTREALEEATLFATVIAATQDAVVTLDSQRRVILANDAAQALAARCGTTVAGLVSVGTDGPDRLAATLDRGLSSVADVVVAPAGEQATVLALRAYPMRHQGRAGAVVFLQDVTEDRRRTEGLRSFARIVAHDLRNPLTGIRLSSELAATALGEGDTDEAAAAMAQIAASGDRASQLLRDVADYSLAGEAELKLEPVHLGDFVGSLVRQRAAEAGAAPLDVRCDADVWVQVDPRLLTRVVENLLGNAAKYCRPGALASVDVAAVEGAAGRVEVLVKDRGIGIPAGEEDRIFEAFHRVPEHATAYAGTGLGLAICRQVIERHGGSICAEPRRGGGTIFRMTLPLAAGPGRVQSPKGPVRVQSPEGPERVQVPTTYGEARHPSYAAALA